MLVPQPRQGRHNIRRGRALPLFLSLSSGLAMPFFCCRRLGHCQDVVFRVPCPCRARGAVRVKCASGVRVCSGSVTLAFRWCPATLFFHVFLVFLLYVDMDSTIPVTAEPKCLVNGPCWFCLV